MMYQRLKNLDNFLKQRIALDSFDSSIAIIDDLESNRSFLQHLAQRLPGVRYVSTFSSASDALDTFSYAAPDLVITDFSMPGMNAAEFLEKFRRAPEFEDVPVIVVSSHNETENRHRALLAGATDFLMVPFDTFEFQARTCNLLKLSLHQKSLRTQSVALRSQLLETRHRSLETQHRFTSIIDSVPALVFAINAEGECLFANQFCFDFFGLDSSKGPPALQFLADEITATNLGGPQTPQDAQEIGFTGLDAEEHIFLVAPKAIKDGGDQNTPFIVYSGIEITRLKDTERSLRRAKEAAEAANRAKSAFLSNMTHEIRTPLNAIIGFTDVICNELHGPIGNEKYKSYLGDIRSSAAHLLAVINEILDFSQIEAQRHKLNLTRFYLRDCLSDAIRLARHQIRARRNRLVIETIPDLRLRTDRQKLHQVLLNILMNANRATPGGTITLSAERRKTGKLVFLIKDTGTGMDKDELALAVTEFGRAMTSAFISDGQSGTGLGLPISIRCMKLLGGDLKIGSEKGVGTAVRLTLPADAVWTGTRGKRKAVRLAAAKRRNRALASRGT